MNKENRNYRHYDSEKELKCRLLEIASKVESDYDALPEQRLKRIMMNYHHLTKMVQDNNYAKTVTIKELDGSYQ